MKYVEISIQVQQGVLMKGNTGGLEGGTGQEWASQERAWTKGGEKPGPRTARQPQSFPVGPGAVPHLPPRGAGATWKSGTLDAPSPQLLAQKEPHQVYFPSLMDVSGTPCLPNLLPTDLLTLETQ